MAEGTRLRALDDRLGVHEGKLVEMVEELSLNREYVSKRFDEVNQRIDGLGDKMDGYFEELKQLLLGFQHSCKEHDTVPLISQASKNASVETTTNTNSTRSKVNSLTQFSTPPVSVVAPPMFPPHYSPYIEKSCATSVAKEKIFLHVLSGDAGGFQFSEFCTLDLRSGEVSECPYALLDDSGSNSMVSVGSVIYVIGALRSDLIRCHTKPPHSRCTKKGHYHKCMSYLDLANDTGDGWKEGPCVSDGPSFNPAVVTLGGKIYLFRCDGDSETAHVFDPFSNKWETLLPPPGVDFFDTYWDTSALADPQNNRILVHFLSIQSLFAYYPDNKRWELVLKPFAWSSRLVFVDGVIFSYLPETPEFVAAYHVATKQWLNIVFTSELSEHIRRSDYDAMFHLGSDLMCLAAYSSDYSPRRTHVYLTKFRFKRSPHNPADLLITLFPSETYTIGACSSIRSFLPI